MTGCAVFGCKNKSCKNKNVRFYRIPSIIKVGCKKTVEFSSRRHRVWLSKLKRRNLDDSAVYRVCERHFINGIPSSLFDDTNPDWAPSQNLEYSNGCKTSYDRYQRLQNRNKNKAIMEVHKASKDLSININCDGDLYLSTNLKTQILSPSLNGDGNTLFTNNCEIPRDMHVHMVECGMQTDIGMEYLRSTEAMVHVLIAEKAHLEESLKQLKLDNETFAEECEKYKKLALKKEFTLESLANDESRLQFYTGLPNYAVFHGIIKYVENYIPKGRNNCLAPVEELTLFLMKLHLGVPFQDLGYRFSVNCSTANRIFHRWLTAMYTCLQNMIRWPDREALVATMPIITWSNYKHHNTVKYLIGISPQGAATFISKGYGGRVTDKFITGHSSVLNGLHPNDIIIADRGFLIAEMVGLHHAQLALPSFTRGKFQLNGQEITETRQIANVRIHIERVIGNIRGKFGILKMQQQIEYLYAKDSDSTTLDKIVFVCVALVNMWESVIPAN